jgi:hypothetical protein
MQLAGWIGLLASAIATATAATARSSLPGAVVTTALSTVAVTVWAGVERRAATGADPAPEGPRTGLWTSGEHLVPLAAAALAGITVGLALGIPADPQPVWLAAVTALGGLAVGLVALAITEDHTLAIAGATATWLTWAGVRMTQVDPFTSTVDVDPQLSLLAGLVAVIALGVAWWLPWAGWIGALLALVALALAPWDAPDVVESYSLPCAALLLAAGLLWRRLRPCPSLHWLGPAVAVALIPTALACWIAPWRWGAGRPAGTSSGWGSRSPPASPRSWSARGGASAGCCCPAPPRWSSSPSRRPTAA